MDTGQVVSESPAPQPQEQEYCSSARAAELLGVSIRAVRQACEAGRYLHRYVARPGGGRRLEVLLASIAPTPPPGGEVLGGEQAAGSRQQEGRADYRDPETGLSPDEAWEHAPESARAEALRRVAIIAQAHGFIGGRARNRRGRRDAVQQFVTTWNAAHPVDEALSVSTLYRWMRDFQAQGRAGLLPAYHTGQKDQDIPEAMVTRFNRAYLSQRQLSVAVCREIVRGELALAGDPAARQVPSAATFRRYVRRLPKATVVMAREGPEAFHRTCQPFLERDYDQIPVMDTWVSDHTEMDFWARRPDGKVVRPWLTLWLDLRSRRRVGWLIHEGPNSDVVLSSLSQGILRFGIPRCCYTDNGRDYSAHALSGRSRRWRVEHDPARVRGMTEHLGVEWAFSIPENPQSRGMIERAFGVDHDRFDRLWPTYCGRGPAHKPEGLDAILQAGKDIPSFLDVQAAYTRYVEEIANALPSEGAGMDGGTPREVFESAEYIKKTATVEELRLLFMRASTPLVVQRNGIWAFDRWYRSEALALRHGERVYYRYNLDDISELYIYSLKDEYLTTVQRRDLASGTAADYRKIQLERKAQRRLARAFLASRDAQAAAPDTLEAMIAARRAATADGGPPTGDRTSRAVRPIRTPFKAAAKAMQSSSSSTSHDALDRETLLREARAMRQRLRAAQAAADAAEPSAADLAAEASTLWRKFKVMRGGKG